MDPALIAAAVGAGTSLYGGKVSGKAAARMQRFNYEMQKEFAQHGVRWRVEDAKAAGLHPLYALGAQTPSASPIYSEDAMGPAIAQAGQNIASGIVARGSRQERMMEQISFKIAQQNLAEGDARINLLNAEAALARQQALATKGFPDVNAPEGLSGVVDAQKANPAMGLVTPVAADLPGSEVNDPSVIAGDPPFWREFNVGGGMKMLLPGGVSGDVSEALESVSESLPLMWSVFRENVNRQGLGWARAFLNRFGFSGFGDLAMAVGSHQFGKKFLRELLGRATRESFENAPPEAFQFYLQ